jgi:hypothetical protein
LIDVLFVFVAAAALIRQLRASTGARPGALGMIRLSAPGHRAPGDHWRHGGGDSLIQQVLGHGIAAKLSQRLGEGVLNGLLTARLGLAAIDVTRPLPFTALPRPALADLAKDLLRKRDGEEVTMNRGRNDKAAEPASSGSPASSARTIERRDPAGRKLRRPAGQLFQRVGIHHDPRQLRSTRSAAA